jgi:D-alanyl-D-alanine carboxypeptidase
VFSSRAAVLVTLAALAPASVAAATTARPHALSGASPRPPHVAARVSRVSAEALRYSYHPGCPVGPSRLRLVRLSYWGFDGHAHRGSIVVNVTAVTAVVAVFDRLYRERFPIRQMRPVDAFRGSDAASMASDNTSGFNCRYAVAAGPRQWSAHAYGEAVDVNPVENPYREAGTVRPAAGARYLDRARFRAGMAVAGGQLVEAFLAVGWYWGGRWSSSPDYQHFSAAGG